MTRIALIQARWHADIVDQVGVGLAAELADRNRGDIVIDTFDTPGAFEIPLMARRLAQSGKYAAVIGAALVVDGGIYRHDFVAAAVVDGLMRAQMDTDVPVLSVSLTPHHFHNSDEHHSFFKTHFVEKGREAARAALSVMAAEAAVQFVA